MAWKEFRRGKTRKLEIQQYEFNLGENLLRLYERLRAKTYGHGPYQSFYVFDPKRRHIHKASITDRLLHQALFRVLYHYFDAQFIFDSYSCRLGKGTHAAVKRLERFARKASRNYRRPVFALKCDIRKFFANIDHDILLHLIQKTIHDHDVIWLVKKVIDSFSEKGGTGIPLGNVTSQLFANIYLNELDYFIKHGLGQKFYLRYCDDFVIVHENRKYLENLVVPISDFLHNTLRLYLHPDKIVVRKLRQGIDFLGYVTLPHYRVIRTKTKQRILRLVNCRNLSSYLGVCRHARAHRIENIIRDKIVC